MAGYFFGVKTCGKVNDVPSVTLKMLRRLVLIFVAWSLVYLLPYNLSAVFEYGPMGPLKVAYWNLTSLMSDPMRAILEGGKVHLWFLVTLGCAVAITGALVCRALYFRGQPQATCIDDTRSFARNRVRVAGILLLPSDSRGHG